MVDFGGKRAVIGLPDGEGGVLPPQALDLTQEDLDARAGDEVRWAASVAAAEAENQRQESIRADANVMDLIDKLKTATPAQIATYMNNNVTNLATAKDMLTRLALILAVAARRIL